MADASHELRTPVATARTAASVALQQPHRDEREYRETLEIIEQQTVRLSRIVDDMFTLARADAGNYPVRTTPMYLDEVVDDVVRAARVLASPRDVSIDAGHDPVRGVHRRRRSDPPPDRQPARQRGPPRAARAAPCAPSSSRPRDGLRHLDQRSGAGHSRRTCSRTSSSGSIAGDAARGRGQSDGGAGLGLALARWIANVHGGDVTLARSSEAGTTFTVSLPGAAARADRRPHLSPVHPRFATLVSRATTTAGRCHERQASTDSDRRSPRDDGLRVYMVVQLERPGAPAPTGNFTNAAMAEVRDAQGQVVLQGQFVAE